jgi:hypothetical protein
MMKGVEPLAHCNRGFAPSLWFESRKDHRFRAPVGRDGLVVAEAPDLRYTPLSGWQGDWHARPTVAV